MRHQELETQAHHSLRALVRTIDKKLHLQVQDGPSPQDPMLTLALSQGPAQASVEIAVEEIRRALDDARYRSMLRERLKRAHERLRFPAKVRPLMSTKAIRPGSEAFSHFRPSGGGRR